MKLDASDSRGRPLPHSVTSLCEILGHCIVYSLVSINVMHCIVRLLLESLVHAMDVAFGELVCQNFQGVVPS